MYIKIGHENKGSKNVHLDEIIFLLSYLVIYFLGIIIEIYLKFIFLLSEWITAWQKNLIYLYLLEEVFGMFRPLMGLTLKLNNLFNFIEIVFLL